jgi:hypothetical protein
MTTSDLASAPASPTGYITSADLLQVYTESFKGEESQVTDERLCLPARDDLEPDTDTSNFNVDIPEAGGYIPFDVPNEGPILDVQDSEQSFSEIMQWHHSTKLGVRAAIGATVSQENSINIENAGWHALFEGEVHNEEHLEIIQPRVDPVPQSPRFVRQPRKYSDFKTLN